MIFCFSLMASYTFYILVGAIERFDFLICDLTGISAYEAGMPVCLENGMDSERSRSYALLNYAVLSLSTYSVILNNEQAVHRANSSHSVITIFCY